ncbi:MAG TPA: LysR family transcriptional regulator [Devosia sp.]|nr:LysR family transcriptional regulator [Devosia sp.]
MHDDEQADAPGDPNAPQGWSLAGPGKDRRRAEITLHQLRIFWAIARAETLTAAAKRLGMAQPSMSQQLSKLETTIGARLFHRRSNELVLTEAGEYLLPRAEHLLRTMNELEEGLHEYGAGQRTTLRLAGINSVLRVLLPRAMNAVQARFPGAEFDIQEGAPNDILNMLYGRSINVGLLAANSVAEAGVGFLQVPIMEDPYVLVVPAALDLDGVADPADLDAGSRAILNSAVQFAFGTQHARRVEDWFASVLPRHRIVAQCRSFEVAVGLARAGAGVCLAPALSTLSDGAALDGIRLYAVNEPPRRLVALVASQYRRQEPYAGLIEALQAAGAAQSLPEIRPTPPFLENLPAIGIHRP